MRLSECDDEREKRETGRQGSGRAEKDKTFGKQYEMREMRLRRGKRVTVCEELSKDKERERKGKSKMRTYENRKGQEESGGVKEKGQKRNRVSRVCAARIRFPHSSYRHT